ncbi:MAG: FKBP-type peptidyl-prolyl cis-trans isomerase, partial [Planctomycetia bacterium]
HALPAPPTPARTPATNLGTLPYSDGSTPDTTSDSETAEIVEPVLETIKEIVAGASTVDSLQVNRGDIVTYRVTVRHAPSSTAPAFSVKIADTLPTGLTLVGTPTVVYHPNYPSSFYTPPVVTTNVGGNPNAFTVLFDYLDHPESPFGAGIVDEAIIEYQATVDVAIADGPATNTAQVTYDSLYGERSSIISPTTTRDYADSDPATLLVDVSSIAGHVYVDANNNGIFDPGETPLPGVTIALIGTSTVGSVSLTATTDASGGYIFSDLDPGTYTLSQPTQPAGYADGKDHVGTIFGGSIAGTGIGSDQITTIVIPNNGQTYSANDYDFGEVEVDLSITKTSVPATYVPGENVIYTIVVTNNSLVDLTGVAVADTFDATRVASAAWTVTFDAGSSGPRSGTGTISDTIALKTGEKATYTVTALTTSTATGNLVNTATVQPPSGTTDKTPRDNTDTETDVAAPKADLRISKTDGVTKYSPGVPLTYTIVVTNDGPSFVTDARVLDDLPAVFTNVSWKVTSYTGTGSGPGTGGPVLNVAQSGDIDTKINLAAGGTATFTVTATVDPSASGDLVNTARVEEPAGVTDPTPGNNTATDIDEFQPLVDLAITKTDGREIAQAGAATTYTIVVTNNGPGTAVGARVFDAVPANMTAGSWTATYSPGSSGDNAGTGGLDTTVTLLPGGAAIFTVVTTVKATATGQVRNTATVEKPAGTIDTDLTNNSATDTNRIPILVAASDADCDGTSQVSIIDPFTGAIRKQFFAYEENFRGGVRVTLADVDGDGIEEIVTAPGAGRMAEVRVFDQNGDELKKYRNRPYGNAYNGGVELAAGDVDGDGDDDIATAMTRGAGDVRVLKSGSSRLAVDVTKSFQPFSPNFRGGATVAMADLNGDRKAEVIVGSGAGIAPSVLVYNVAGAPTVVDRISPLSSSLRGGVTVSAARWNADATPDIVVAGGRGAGSVTEVYDGTIAATTNVRLARQTAFAGLASRNAATFAAGIDIDGDNRADRFMVTQGNGGASSGVRVINATTGATVGTFASALKSPLRIAASAPRRDTSLVTTATGLQYRDVKVGTGTAAETGKYVKVHYVGSLRDGTVFDSSRDRRGGTAFDFRLGVGDVIAGWDEGVAGMKVGGRRTLIIPANLAYEGKSGPQGTLVFDVELLEVSDTPFP